VKLKLLQGNPHQLARMVARGRDRRLDRDRGARRVYASSSRCRATDGTTASSCPTAIRSRK
jgi:hypothetical protein